MWTDNPTRPIFFPAQASASQWLNLTSPAFKQALDEYDKTRGRKSGNFSSFSCLILIVLLTLFLILFVLLGGYFLREF